MRQRHFCNLYGEKENSEISFVWEPFGAIFMVKKKIGNKFCVRAILCNFYGGKENWELILCARVVEAPKKRRQKRRQYIVNAVLETGLALMIILRCDWPLCDIWFKSYEHFKIKMFLSVHTAGPWWIFQPKFYTFRVKSAPFKKAPGKKAPFRRLCAFSHLGALSCQQLYFKQHVKIVLVSIFSHWLDAVISRGRDGPSPPVLYSEACSDTIPGLYMG